MGPCHGRPLNGRRATTHWEDLEEFAARYPEIDVQARPLRDRRRALHHRRRLPGARSDAAPHSRPPRPRAGARCGERLHLRRAARSGRPAAHGLARPARPRGAARGRGDPQHGGAHRAAAGRSRSWHCRAGIGERMLETLFARSVDMSPRDYYAALRLNAGRRLVLETRKSMTEIAAQTGFASASAFARSFRGRFRRKSRERPASAEAPARSACRAEPGDIAARDQAVSDAIISWWSSVPRACPAECGGSRPPKRWRTSSTEAATWPPRP